MLTCLSDSNCSRVIVSPTCGWSAHHAGEPLVHQMLYDQIVRRIDDPAEHERGGPGHDAGLDQVVAIRGQAQLDPGRDRLKPRNDRGHQYELDIAIGRDRQHPLGTGWIEVLLAERRVIEPRQCVGNGRRELKCDRRRLDAVAFADEELVLEHDAQPRERIGQGSYHIVDDGCVECLT